MNESWPMMNTSMLPPGKKAAEVSDVDINSLLKGRTFGNKQSENVPFNMNPAIPAYDENDMRELQEYCQSRGIIGVNFNGKDPKAILRMLKSRMGERSEPTSKRGLLNG
jgi:hypothetical protein